MSEWQPIEQAKSGRYLLWVEDAGFSGPLMGRVIENEGFSACIPDGFHGDWNVTHFMKIESPIQKPKGETE